MCCSSYALIEIIPKERSANESNGAPSYFICALDLSVVKKHIYIEVSFFLPY